MHSTHSCIAKDIACSIQHTVLTSDMLSSFNTLTNLAAFLLCQACHNCELHFTTIMILNEADVVIYEINFNTFFLELACIFQCFHSISGKAADLSGHDHVNLASLCIFYHPEEIRTLLGLRTRNSILFYSTINSNTGNTISDKCSNI